MTACTCDFCRRVKRWEDNWCPRCGKVQLKFPKWWENLDVCEQCMTETRPTEIEETP